MNYDNIINKNKPMTYKLQTKDNRVFTQMAFDLVFLFCSLVLWLCYAIQYFSQVYLQIIFENIVSKNGNYNYKIYI